MHVEFGTGTHPSCKQAQVRSAALIAEQAQKTYLRFAVKTEVDTGAPLPLLCTAEVRSALRKCASSQPQSCRVDSCALSSR